MTDIQKNSSWTENSKYVLITIEKLTTGIATLYDTTVSNKEELLAKANHDKEEIVNIINKLSNQLTTLDTTMKVRNAIYGTIAGLFGGGIISIITLILA